MFCVKCGCENKEGGNFCTACGTVLAPSEKSVAQPAPVVVIQQSVKNAGIAAVLSFFWCGLGQIYNGEIGKGIAFVVGYIISWLLMVVIIGFITTPILWIWGMIDAYRTAERLSQAVKR